MPKTPVDYSKTQFYKIVCKDLSIKDCYVGHTTDFRRRKYEHKRRAKNESVQDGCKCLYEFIRNNNGWVNFDMILIDTIKCDNSLQARAIEREIIEEVNPSLNRCKKPVSSTDEKKEQEQQWRKNNIAYVRENGKVYYENNKDKLKKEFKRYREEHSEQVKEQQKQWRINNNEKQKEYHKNKYQQNREQILMENKIKIECECGTVYTKHHKARHEKSKKHQDHINNQ